jgi:hypothetical protein
MNTKHSGMPLSLEEAQQTFVARGSSMLSALQPPQRLSYPTTKTENIPFPILSDFFFSCSLLNLKAAFLTQELTLQRKLINHLSKPSHHPS